LNLKMVILSHWKMLLLVAQFSLLVVSIVTITPLGDPIDDPICPG